MTGPRLRLVAWRVQPIVMADDGENLTPVQVGPQDIPAGDWEAFKVDGDQAALDAVAEQIAGSPEPN